MVKLFRKNSNLRDHNPPTLPTDRQTDRQMTCDCKTALCTKVHRAVKTKHNPEKANNTQYDNKTSLVSSLLTTLGQETRWAYSTKLPSPQGLQS